MKDRKRIGYMCGVDFQYHIEGDDAKVFSSVKSLKREKGCTDQCGIVEVEVRVKKWIAPQKF